MEKMKRTKKDVLMEMKGIFLEMQRIDLVDFCDHEIELLNRKKVNSSKTKTQVENESIKELIVKALTEINKPVTISEMQELNSEVGNYSNQKINALLKQLIETGEVKRIVDKKKAYFSV